jgi:hypothetical protein
MTMDNQTTAVRRPVALWVLVGVYSTLILGSFAFTIYLQFWSSYSDKFGARFADWTLLDYAISYHPGILILLGCLGLVMLRRWAVYVFGVLLALRLRELAMALLRDDLPEDAVILVWLPNAMFLATAAIAFFYALHLSRKGTLRKGVY